MCAKIDVISCESVVSPRCPTRQQFLVFFVLIAPLLTTSDQRPYNLSDFLLKTQSSMHAEENICMSLSCQTKNKWVSFSFVDKGKIRRWFQSLEQFSRVFWVNIHSFPKPMKDLFNKIFISYTRIYFLKTFPHFPKISVYLLLIERCS